MTFSSFVFFYYYLQSSCKTNSSAENTPRSARQDVDNTNRQEASSDNEERSKRERRDSSEKPYHQDTQHQSRSTYSDLMDTLKELEDDVEDKKPYKNTTSTAQRKYTRAWSPLTSCYECVAEWLSVELKIERSWIRSLYEAFGDRNHVIEIANHS